MSESEMKALVMTILFVGDQLERAIRLAAGGAAPSTDLGTIRKRADGIWAEASK